MNICFQNFGPFLYVEIILSIHFQRRNVPPTLVTWRRAPHPFPSHFPRNGQKWEKERLPNFGRGREADGTTESILGDVTVPTAPLSLSFIYLSFYFGFNHFFFFSSTLFLPFGQKVVGLRTLSTQTKPRPDIGFGRTRTGTCSHIVRVLSYFLVLAALLSSTAMAHWAVQTPIYTLKKGKAELFLLHLDRQKSAPSSGCVFMSWTPSPPIQ